MKNVIILGAGGSIAKHVIDLLAKKEEINLTLFLRNTSKLKNRNIPRAKIVERDVLNLNQLTEAIAGQDIVYVNLAGDLEVMAENIVGAMEKNRNSNCHFHQLNRNL